MSKTVRIEKYVSSTHVNVLQFDPNRNCECESFIDEYPVLVQYIDPPVSTQDELHFIYVNLIMNNAAAR
ncbi:unnamed protein product, partial [Rotaria magnacalcarata]